MDETKGNNNNRGMMLIIMGMLGLIILALVGVAVFVILNMDAITGEREPALPPGYHYDLDLSAMQLVLFDLGSDIVTNLHSPGVGSGGFARLTLSLGINNLEEDEANEFMADLRVREMVVVDAVNTILRRTTAEELNRIQGHDVLREDILTALQSAFNTHMIVAVYFQVSVH